MQIVQKARLRNLHSFVALGFVYAIVTRVLLTHSATYESLIKIRANEIAAWRGCFLRLKRNRSCLFSKLCSISLLGCHFTLYFSHIYLTKHNRQLARQIGPIWLPSFDRGDQFAIYKSVAYARLGIRNYQFDEQKMVSGDQKAANWILFTFRNRIIAILPWVPSKIVKLSPLSTWSMWRFSFRPSHLTDESMRKQRMS